MTIMNPDAYEAGRMRRIRENSRKTGRAKWFAAHEDAQRLHDWLLCCGEFADRIVTKDPADQAAYDEQLAEIWARANAEGFDPHADVWELDEKFQTRMEHNPATKGMFAGDFGNVLLSMRDALLDWGKLSDKQTALVRKALARKLEWIAQDEQRKAERAEELKSSEFVGEVKQRMVFDLTVNKVLSFEGQFGTTFIHLCEDADGNQIVYKGSKRFAEGALKVKATVKAHDTREGVKQTLIARPTEVE